MLDVQVLADAPSHSDLPTALAQLSLGEQVGRAYAPRVRPLRHDEWSRVTNPEQPPA